MRHFGNLALIILTISILSYGFAGLSFAQSSINQTQQASQCGPNQVFQLGECVDVEKQGPQAFNIKTDQPIKSPYDDGDIIKITGNVGSISQSFPNTPLTIIITGPTGNIVGIAQVTPSSSGEFSHNVIAGGTMNTTGEYLITAQYGTQKATTKFAFTASGFTAPPLTECDPSEKLVNGKCIKIETEPPLCKSNQTLVNGKCVDKEPPKCGPNQTLVNGKCIDKEPDPVCGPGTVLKNGICVVQEPTSKPGGGCLIATATYGSELAPQVQFLREIRDNTVLSTNSGTSFMNSFNQFYYSFSPTIADWERQNPIFKEATKLFITPMISTLSIMTFADPGSEAEVLAFGISVIALNVGMYIVAPTAFAYKVHRHIKSRK